MPPRFWEGARGRPLHPYQSMLTGTPQRAHMLGGAADLRRIIHMSLTRWGVALCTSRQGPLFDNAYTCTRPPVGPTLRDSFLFVNGFSQLCPPGTTAPPSSRRRQQALAPNGCDHTESGYPLFIHCPRGVFHTWDLRASPVPLVPHRRRGRRSRAETADQSAGQERCNGRAPGCASAAPRRSP
jgi:hypothetical protein